MMAKIPSQHQKNWWFLINEYSRVWQQVTEAEDIEGQADYKHRWEAQNFNGIKEILL